MAFPERLANITHIFHAFAMMGCVAAKETALLVFIVMA